MLLSLLPASWRPIAKAVLTAATAILVALPQVIPSLPESWQAGLSAFALAALPVVTWLVRNQDESNTPDAPQDVEAV